MKVCIITGGELELFWAGEQLKNRDEYYVIAVDGGLSAAHSLCIKPDCIVGDFDTVAPSVLEEYEEQGIRILRHIPEKDYTDTELALVEAISMEGVSEVVILGALGRRFDHALANLEILMAGLPKGITCKILDPYNKIYLIDGDRSFRKEALYGKYISFIPFTDHVRGVTLKGFKYPLQDAIMKRGVSLGISNEIPGERAELSLKEGILICIESRD